MRHAISHAQQGAVALIVALWMGVALSCLMVLDIGNLIWQQRELQKIADLAALAGASGDCSSQALRNAQQNGLSPSAKLEATSGSWAPAAGVPQAQFFQATNSSPNACKVVVTLSVPMFFVWQTGLQSREITTQAVARQKSPLAKITVRSTLLSLSTANSPLLNPLVNQLLGGNLSVDALSWKSLAGVNLSLLEFLDALIIQLHLDAGRYQDVLQTDASLGDLTLAMAKVLRQNQQTAAASVLEGLSLQVSALTVRLGDLLKVSTAGSQEALRADLDALGLLMAMVELANSRNGVAADLSVPYLSSTSNSSLAALTLKVVEPPQWALGIPGQQAIQAQTAALRLGADVHVNLGSLLSIPGLNLDLLGVTLGLNLAPAKARVRTEAETAVQNIFVCAAPQKSLRLNTEAGLLELSLQLTLLGTATTPVTIKVMGNPDSQLEYINLPTLDMEPQWKKTSGISVTALVQGVMSLLANALPTLLGELASAIKIPLLSDLLSWVLGDVVGELLKAVTQLLTPILTPLASLLLQPVLDTLLNLLGLELGKAEFGAQLDCGGGAELVY